jgi:hypothetical protein
VSQDASIAASSWAVSAWLMTAVPRFRAALRATMADRSGSSARIQPTRRPPHSTLAAEPTATTRVLSAASGGGGGGSAAGAPSTRSASVRSSTTVTRPASAMAANAWRRTSGMTAPVGL